MENTYSTIKIKNINQVDQHTFSITWNDNIIGHYRLSELQKNCPCANCNDEQTGKKLIDSKTIDSNVSAKKISSVGRYALKIEFTSGCSTGIYEFDMLYEMIGKSL